MSINEIYAIYDYATECFVQFIPCVNEKLADMTIRKMFKDKRLNIPMLYDYPDNFSVYKIGSFDDNKGLFSNEDPHKLLFTFSSLALSDAVV